MEQIIEYVYYLIGYEIHITSSAFIVHKRTPTRADIISRVNTLLVLLLNVRSVGRQTPTDQHLTYIYIYMCLVKQIVEPSRFIHSFAFERN